MAKQVINLGTAPTGAGGDDRRSAWLKAIANFTELYDFLAGSVNSTALPASLAAAITAAGGYRKATILGSVSQADGVPTGAIVERGINANGEYVRFADGTQICTFKSRTIKTANIATGSLFHGGLEPARSFPIAFAAAPAIQISAGLEVGEGWFSMAAGQLPDGLLLSTARWPGGYVFTQVARAATQVCVEYVAIGRWF
ncbi:TPA: hypothetical protein SLP05_004245 [Pseudomonas putida]|uniref:hypothetical protein n=1 Tax=Pseudomonas putida TaxID=303 RepID=UPI00187D305D|nr:hypothetical protein [Pseudomonas putida]MDD2019050.1 hypothetical protein [Pseudomonas putida]HEJ1056633.1 hypothetical protein [Pseudomonas putida]